MPDACGCTRVCACVVCQDSKPHNTRRRRVTTKRQEAHSQSHVRRWEVGGNRQWMEGIGEENSPRRQNIGRKKNREVLLFLIIYFLAIWLQLTSGWEIQQTNLSLKERKVCQHSRHFIRFNAERSFTPEANQPLETAATHCLADMTTMTWWSSMWASRGECYSWCQTGCRSPLRLSQHHKYFHNILRAEKTLVGGCRVEENVPMTAGVRGQTGCRACGFVCVMCT